MKSRIYNRTKHHLCHKNKYELAGYTFPIKLGSPHCSHRPASRDEKVMSIQILIIKVNEYQTCWGQWTAQQLQLIYQQNNINERVAANSNP